MSERRGRTHVCACGCGQQIRLNRFACRDGWQRLPGAHQLAVVTNDADVEAHAEAKQRARDWFGEHPATGARVFRADGPEPPATVKVLHAPAKDGSDGYLKRCAREGWLWALTPTARVGDRGFMWPPDPSTLGGPLTEVRQSGAEQ